MNTTTHIRHIYDLKLKSNGYTVDYVTVGNTLMFGVALDMPENGELHIHNRKKLAVTGKVITRNHTDDGNLDTVITNVEVTCQIVEADPASRQLTVTFDRYPDVVGTGMMALGDDY